MKFTIIERKIQLKPGAKEYIEKKLSKLDKFFKEESQARVVVGTIKDMEYVEVNLYAGGMVYRAETTDEHATTATDRLVDIIERQIRKNKTRLSKKLRDVASWDTELINGSAYTEGEDTEEFQIVRTKRFNVKPMSPEEAVLQMKLLGHSFFVFKNQDTEELNIVYERKDGKYAIIESVE